MGTKKTRQTDKQLTDINMIQTPASTSANSKVGKLIRELRENVSRKNIVLLLVEIAERPETSIDFDITLGSYLNMFLQCQGEIVMSEAGHLILSAAKIYSRRVDSIYESMQKIVSGMEKSIKAVEVGKKSSPIKQKRALKRPRTEQDPLYEADLQPKHIKTVPLSKTTEALSSFNSFEAPKNYFRHWKKYREWRAQHKSKLNCQLPYSTLQDNIPLHPSLWNLSCIEDFDFEDDIDTKRNYRVFTNYIEHRHNTVVDDINFIMHFKVKDFIEAEEDEIEIMSILGLPPPPKRKWPPICKNVQAKQKNHDDCSEVSSEDYIKNYLQLENALLENENCNSKNQTQQKNAEDLFEKYKNLVKGKENNRSSIETNRNVDIAPSGDDEIQVNLISEIPLTGTYNKNNNMDFNDDTTTNQQRQTVSECTSLTPLEYTDFEQNLNSDNLDIHSTQTVEATLSTVELEIQNQANSNCIEYDGSDLGINNRNDETITENAGNPVIMVDNSISCTVLNETTESAAHIVNNNNVNVGASTSNEITADHSLQYVCDTINEAENLPGNNKNNQHLKDRFLNDNNNIVIRLTADERDEGIALSDLDEIELAMLRPSVSLVDILKPIMDDVSSPTELVFRSEPFSNFLDIDKSLLVFQEDFQLPSNVLKKADVISRNLLEIPEKLLRKRHLFKLPPDFNIFTTNRNKRNTVDAPSTKRIKLCKPIDNTLSPAVLTTRRSTATSDFLGFEETTNVCENHINYEQTQEDTIASKTYRSVSRDSGIGISSAENTFSTIGEKSVTNNIDECLSNVSNLNQSHTNDAISQDISILCNPDHHSTAIQDNICPLSSSDLASSINCTINIQSTSQAEYSSAEQIASTSHEDNSDASCTGLFEETLLNCTEPSRHNSTSRTSLENNNRTTDLNINIDKVQKWHRHLKPILQKSKERHHFDVFAIGTEIIDKLSENEIGKEVITFDDVMKQKDPNYISRYFLSTLLLANQNNITLEVLNTNKDEPIPLNKIQLTLKSKQRHTISIDDDIGANTSKRKRTYSSDEEPQTQSPRNELLVNSSRDIIENGLSLFEKNDEKRVEILKKYRETNREMLIKAIEENRDDYIRILSRKHSIDLGLYFTEEEIERFNSEENQRNFENECLIYPKNINIRQNKKKTVDDADSGFHSHNTREPESADP